MKEEVIRVSANSQPSLVAGAIAGKLREHGLTIVQAIGPAAVNQMIKATIIARSYVAEDGLDLVFAPSYTNVTIDDQELTAIRLVVEVRKADGE